MKGFEDYGTWKPTIMYICKNGPRQLWAGLQFVKWRDMLGREGDVPDEFREPYPFVLVPCKCEGCVDEERFQAKTGIALRP